MLLPSFLDRRCQSLPFQETGHFSDLLFAGQMCHARGGRRRRSGGSSASPLSIRFSTSPSLPLPLPLSITIYYLPPSAEGGATMSATVPSSERASERRCLTMPLPLRDHHAFLPPFSLSSPLSLPARSLSLVLPEDHGWREATFRQREEFDRRTIRSRNWTSFAIPPF